MKNKFDPIYARKIKNNIEVIEKTIADFLQKSMAKTDKSVEAIAILMIPSKVMGLIAKELLEADEKYDLFGDGDIEILKTLITNHENVRITLDKICLNLDNDEFKKDCDEFLKKEKETNETNKI
jgi:hypothetical protein